MGGPRITVLVENTASHAGLIAEHGLSVWIETGDNRYLFDTGQGPALGVNARMLGIPLEKTDAVMLSHGHYDHTGGLLHVLGLQERHPSMRTLRHSSPSTLLDRALPRATSACRRG